MTAKAAKDKDCGRVTRRASDHLFEGSKGTAISEAEFKEIFHFAEVHTSFLWWGKPPPYKILLTIASCPSCLRGESKSAISAFMIRISHVECRQLNPGKLWPLLLTIDYLRLTIAYV